MMREIEKPKEERPDFNFGVRPRLIQAGQEFKLICCVQCTPTPKVEIKSFGYLVDRNDEPKKRVSVEKFSNVFQLNYLHYFLYPLI